MKHWQVKTVASLIFFFIFTGATAKADTPMQGECTDGPDMYTTNKSGAEDYIAESFPLRIWIIPVKNVYEVDFSATLQSLLPRVHKLATYAECQVTPIPYKHGLSDVNCEYYNGGKENTQELLDNTLSGSIGSLSSQNQLKFSLHTKANIKIGFCSERKVAVFSVGTLQNNSETFRERIFAAQTYWRPVEFDIQKRPQRESDYTF